MTVTHAFVNPKADGPDATIVRPSDWNDGHVVNIAAAEVPFTPAGTIAATDVQAAIEEVAAEAGGALVGGSTPLTIASGAIDATGLHYIVLSPQGGVTDALDTITGGVDGQLLLIEAAASVGGGNPINITPNGNILFANQELANLPLGSVFLFVDLVYSAARSAWLLRSELNNTILADSDDSTEINAYTGEIDAIVSGEGVWYALPNRLEVLKPLIYVGAQPAPADGLLGAGDWSPWFDKTNGAASPMWKGKQADGTVVSGSLGGGGGSGSFLSIAKWT